MNRVYFSDVDNESKFKSNCGCLKLIIVPTKWWSIAAWRIAIEFSRSFESGFYREE